MKILTIQFTDGTISEWFDDEYTGWEWDENYEKFKIYNPSLTAVYKLEYVKYIDEREIKNYESN